MADDLSLVPTQTLLNELKGRFENVLFVGHHPRSDKEDESVYDYAGSWLSMLGMATRITYKMQQEMDEDSSQHDIGDT